MKVKVALKIVGKTEERVRRGMGEGEVKCMESEERTIST